MKQVKLIRQHVHVTVIRLMLTHNFVYVYFPGHSEKIYFVAFHPLAKDVLASGSYDMSVLIWDLSTQEKVLKLTGHTDTVGIVLSSVDHDS